MEHMPHPHPVEAPVPDPTSPPTGSRWPILVAVACLTLARLLDAIDGARAGAWWSFGGGVIVTAVVFAWVRGGAAMSVPQRRALQAGAIAYAIGETIAAVHAPGAYRVIGAAGAILLAISALASAPRRGSAGGG